MRPQYIYIHISWIYKDAPIHKTLDPLPSPPRAPRVSRDYSCALDSILGLLGAATPHSDSTGRTPHLWSLKPEVEPLHTSWTWLPLEPTCTPGLVWPSKPFPHFLEVSMASIFLTPFVYPSGASKALLHIPAGEPGYFSCLQWVNPGTWRTPCPPSLPFLLWIQVSVCVIRKE